MDNRNLIVAIALSLAILLGFQFFFEQPVPERPAQQAGDSVAVPSDTASDVPRPSDAPSAAPSAVLSPAGGPDAVVPVGASRTDALAGVPRVPISTPRLHGSIALEGGRIDDITLADYHETIEPGSPEIVMLSPPGAPHPYYGEFGWVAADPTVRVPDATTRWSTSALRLTAGAPISLTWDNGAGLIFGKRIAIDANYMFTVEQTVENRTGAPVTLHPYGLVSRAGTPDTEGFFILHEGPVGVLGGALKEYDYDDLQDGGGAQQDSTGGWLGITDKYWLAALVPDQAATFKARFSHTLRNDTDRYQVDYLHAAVVARPGGTVVATNRLFVGAKEVNLLDSYRDNLGIEDFDLAVDFGWFYFLTKPIFYALDWLYGLLGNFGLAILALTVAVKLLFFPLANKSYEAMSKMKLLQPEMQKMRERYGDDRQKMNQELMALYRKEKINPAAGCLPILIQIPVFFALYKVLFVAIEMRHAPFYGWIKDLSAPDPTNMFTLFGLFPWDTPSYLHMGIWPLIMGATMFLQMKLNPQPADPVQARIFMFMPVIFTVLLATFPAGLVIYWSWNNLLSIAQQWVIMRRANARAAAAKAPPPVKKG